MADAILVINAGSSSIKFSLFRDSGPELTAHLKGQIEGIYTAPHFEGKDASGKRLEEKTWPAGTQLGHHGAIAAILAFLDGHMEDHRLVGVGHRVVHGGVDFLEPVRIDADVLRKLEHLIPLAPLHQPHNLEPIRAIAERQPDLAQIACFDTAFHRSQPAVAQAFALPESITDLGVHRYGFHGLSYEYIARVLPRYDARAAGGKTVVLHLGNGASMCAMEGGRSVATTMGFTAVEGLPMGTRCGALDPGVMLYLMDELKMDARSIERLIYHQSGLLGVSGVSSDMRELLASSQPRAKFAVDLFVYRVRREVGALSAALGGLDALVFTAGIGERAAPVRERICRDAAWLGLDFDAAANAIDGPRISTVSSHVSAWVIPTNEELMIAQHTRDALR